MTPPTPIDVERDALARFERLVDAPTARRRERILAGASDAVRARVAALEDRLAAGAAAIPTLVPGSGELADAALPPARVGAFRLTELLGRGGMGEVWAGVRDDGLFDQTVAIKLIQRHALARAAAAFDDERRFLARLEHPNICRLIDGGVTEDGLQWLAMEYCDGQPIDEGVADRPLAARVAAFAKVADAVQYAHSRMVAHADLKPSNILVARDGTPKLLDFGIARLIGDPAEGAATPSGTAGAVTREFASPQRLAGAGPSVPDDIFALGRTLTILIGDEGDHELAAVAARATHADEGRRYGSVAALVADLDRWRARLPVEALPPTLAYRANKFVERHRWGVGATGMALVLLSATSLLATSSYLRAEHTRVRAEQRFDDVRDLSRFMLFDLYEELARRPGTVAKRAEIAATSARYLDRLSITGESGADLRLDTARSYRRLAEIQGVPAPSNLGQPEQAWRSLAHARTLLTGLLAMQPGNAAALSELGWVELDRWALLADNPAAAKTRVAAQVAFRRAIGLDRTDGAARLGLVAAAQAHAYELVWSRDLPAQAIPVAREALDALRARRWPTALRPRAAALEAALLNQLGDATYYSGDMAGALPSYQAADALIERRIATEGATPELLIAKGTSAFNISGTLGDLGGHDVAALATARAGIRRLQALLAAGPDAAAEKRLLVLHGQEAVVLENMGRIDEALAPLQAGIELREARLAAAPRDPQRARDLAIGLIQQARVLGLAGRRVEACAVATRNMALWRRIAANGNLSTHDTAQEVSKTGTLQKKLCRA